MEQTVMYCYTCRDETRINIEVRERAIRNLNKLSSEPCEHFVCTRCNSYVAKRKEGVQPTRIPSKSMRRARGVLLRNMTACEIRADVTFYQVYALLRRHVGERFKINDCYDTTLLYTLANLVEGLATYEFARKKLKNFRLRD